MTEKKVRNPKGNPGGPNWPCRETQFGGPRANPQGVTRAIFEKREENARKALEIQERLLNAVTEGLDEDALGLVKSDVLKLIDSAMDRAYGKAGQSIDITSKGESVAPAQSDAVLEALKRKHDPDAG